MVLRGIASLVETHSSITSASGAANTPIKSLNGPVGSAAVTPSSRRAAGLRICTAPATSTTSSPDARLSMICSLSRSDASARA